MKNLYYTIKYGFQGMFRGYDDRIFWSLSDYFHTFIKPIKQFCEHELSKTEIMKLNPKRKDLFEETLKRIEAYEKMDWQDLMQWNNKTNELWGLIGENITTYWN